MEGQPAVPDPLRRGNRARGRARRLSGKDVREIEGADNGGPVMTRLSAFPSAPVLAVITIAALAATIVIGLQFLPMDKPGGYGIVDFELAFTQDKAGEMLQAWGPAARQAMHDG